MGTAADQFLEEASSGQGYPAVKFTSINDSVAGTIVTDPKPVERKNLNDGSPEKQLPINLDTKGNGNEDDFRTLWVRKGFMAGAISDAVKAAGANGLAIGGKLGVRMTELRDTGKPQPAKVFEAKYEPPVNQTSVDDIF